MIESERYWFIARMNESKSDWLIERPESMGRKCYPSKVEVWREWFLFKCREILILVFICKGLVLLPPKFGSVLYRRTFCLIQAEILFYTGGNFVLYRRTFCFIQADILFYTSGHFVLYRRKFCFIQTDILFYTGGHFV